MGTNTLYEEYTKKMRKIADVKYAAAVLQWDQETYLPVKGNEIRGQQLATLSEMAHELLIDEHLGTLLEQLLSSNQLTEDERRNAELSLEDYHRNCKLSPEFVGKMSEAVTRTYHAWVQARKDNSFAGFEAPLDELIGLKKQEADLLGFTNHPYNALLNDYDKGLTVNKLDVLFKDLRPALTEILDKIKTQPEINHQFLLQPFEKDKQWEFGIRMLKTIGFDFEAGRQDLSVHPFTTSFNAADVRVTTRIDENDFGNMTWSCIHEGGHALYEQGLPQEQYGLPLGEYCSLSIHESQSRLWENGIGRSAAFWERQFPELKALFPVQLKEVTVRDFYKGINKVAPSFIRTEADELTYHFHVMIRYEIEKLLIEGSLKTKDIPACWNEKYQHYLGIRVPDDNRGCLQDIHWSHGSFGYFATYSIGSLYAAQFLTTIEKSHPELMEMVNKGDFNIIRQWLGKNIYAHGRKYRSEDLCTKITGEPLNAKYFIEYAQKKYTDIFSS